jgi:hypothetical protein
MAEIQDYQIAAQPGSPARLIMTLPHPRFCATLLAFGVRKPESGIIAGRGSGCVMSGCTMDVSNQCEQFRPAFFSSPGHHDAGDEHSFFSLSGPLS